MASRLVTGSPASAASGASSGRARRGVAPLRRRPQAEVGGALDDEQPYGPGSLQLNDERPLEAQRGCEQRRGRQELGQRSPQRRRVRMLVEDFAAGLVQAHEGAAHRRTLEEEARDAVLEAVGGVSTGQLLIALVDPA